VEKKTLKDAKEAAQHFLEECPKEIIQCSILIVAVYECLLQGLTVVMNPGAPVAGVAKA